MKKLSLLFILSFITCHAMEPDLQETLSRRSINRERNQEKKDRKHHAKAMRLVKKAHKKNVRKELVASATAKKRSQKYFSTINADIQNEFKKQTPFCATELPAASPTSQKPIHYIPEDMVALLLEGGIPPQGHFLNDPEYMAKYEWKIAPSTEEPEELNFPLFD